MVLQACLASKIEEVCDGIEDELKAQGMTLRMRYSPGYFDLDIKENKKFFELMDITKRIGLTQQRLIIQPLFSFISINYISER